MATTLQQRQPDQREGSPRLFAKLRGLAEQASDLLYPPICALCAIPLRQRTGESARIQLCSRCQSDLSQAEQPRCQKCARPIPQGASATSVDCPHCRGKRLRFDATFALGVYDGIVREAVLQMKKSNGEAATIAMGHLLADHLSQMLSDRPTHLVTVPTYWTRRLARNVNCAEILAESLAKRLEIASFPRLVRCRHKTRKQGTLTPEERRSNVRGAYRVSTGYVINDAKVLLVDDVMTTGATASEIAKILRRAGAARVEVAVIARGIGFDG